MAPSSRNALDARRTRRTSGIPCPQGRKVTKVKTSLSAVVRSTLQGRDYKKATTKSVRFKGIAENPFRSRAQPVADFTKEANNSHIDSDFVFEADPNALASILDEGITREQLIKTRIAEESTKEKTPDELLLANGRPSLCAQRVPVQRASSILPGGRQSFLSNRVSAGPARVERPSMSGQQSFFKGSSSNPFARNSLYSIIAQKYSQSHQLDPAQSARRTTIAATGCMRPSHASPSKNKRETLEPGRVLSTKKKLQPTPHGRIAATPNPMLGSPALRVRKGISRTPGQSKLASSPELKSKVATVLDFQDNENQSPNIKRPQNSQKQLSKPKKSVSKLRPPSQVKTTVVNSNKSRLPPRNSDRYSFIRKAPLKKQSQKEATVNYVEPELKNDEEIVQPKTLNDVKSDKRCETAAGQDANNVKAKFDGNLPRSQTFARKTAIDADAILELMHQKLRRIKRRSVQNELLSVVRDVERIALGTVKEVNESDDKADISASNEDSKSPCNKQATPSVSKDVNKSWREILQNEPSPKWKDVLDKESSTHKSNAEKSAADSDRNDTESLQPKNDGLCGTESRNQDKDKQAPSQERTQSSREDESSAKDAVLSITKERIRNIFGSTSDWPMARPSVSFNRISGRFESTGPLLKQQNDGFSEDIRKISQIPQSYRKNLAISQENGSELSGSSRQQHCCISTLSKPGINSAEWIVKTPKFKADKEEHALSVVTREKSPRFADSKLDKVCWVEKTPGSSKLNEFHDVAEDGVLDLRKPGKKYDNQIDKSKEAKGCCNSSVQITADSQASEEKENKDLTPNVIAANKPKMCDNISWDGTVRHKISSGRILKFSDDKKCDAIEKEVPVIKVFSPKTRSAEKRKNSPGPGRCALRHTASVEPLLMPLSEGSGSVQDAKTPGRSEKGSKVDGICDLGSAVGADDFNVSLLDSLHVVSMETKRNRSKSEILSALDGKIGDNPLKSDQSEHAEDETNAKCSEQDSENLKICRNGVELSNESTFPHNSNSSDSSIESESVNMKNSHHPVDGNQGSFNEFCFSQNSAGSDLFRSKSDSENPKNIHDVVDSNLELPIESRLYQNSTCVETPIHKSEEVEFKLSGDLEIQSKPKNGAIDHSEKSHRDSEASDNDFQSQIKLHSPDINAVKARSCEDIVKSSTIIDRENSPMSATLLKPSLKKFGSTPRVQNRVDDRSNRTGVVAPKAVMPPPLQTPAAFRQLRRRLQESPTPKSFRSRRLDLKSPSRGGVRKTPQKKVGFLLTSPSMKSMCSKRFAEALLDEEVALLTCRKFRSPSTPSKSRIPRASQNPIGRMLMKGDDSHFIPVSPMAATKQLQSTAFGSAFSAFKQ